MRDDQLHAFLGEARARTRIDARRRRRWLLRQLDEDRTFDEVWREAVDAGAPIDLVVAGGRTYRGIPAIAGGAVLAVSPSVGGIAYIATSAIVAVRVEPVSARADRPGDVVRAGTVADVIAVLAERHLDVSVGTAGGVHHGRIAGVGRDLLWFADGLHVRMSAVTDVVPSG